MTYIETPRLLLRDWKEEDISPFSNMNSDPHVMKYFLKRLTGQESLDYYNRIRDEFVQFGYGLYAVEKKEDGTFIGYTGFHNISFDLEFVRGIEIGWRIRHEDWNKGYATEAAQAALQYAGTHLPFDEVWAFTSALNSASERVMQKIGMAKIREFRHPLVPDGHPLLEHVLYYIHL